MLDALISSGEKKKQIQGEIGCHNNTDSNKNPLKTTQNKQTPGPEEGNRQQLHRRSSTAYPTSTPRGSHVKSKGKINSSKTASKPHQKQHPKGNKQVTDANVYKGPLIQMHTAASTPAPKHTTRHRNPPQKLLAATKRCCQQHHAAAKPKSAPCRPGNQHLLAATNTPATTTEQLCQNSC